jgi:hypothetical protein
VVLFKYDYRYRLHLIVLMQYSIELYNLKNCIFAGMQEQGVRVYDAQASRVYDGSSP